MVYNRNEPGNAWDYYSAAMEKSKNIKLTIILERYLGGSSGITPEILQSIKDNEDAIEKFKEGARQKFCSIPYDYSKGVGIKIPDFMTLKRITEITCMKSLMELENGKNEKTLDDILSVAVVGKHIANSAPNVFNQMIGIVFFGQAMKVLKTGLSADVFNLTELNVVSDSLSSLEKSFPMLASGLDGEKKLWKISVANLPFYESENGFAGLFFYENKMPSVFEHIVFRFYCWRYLFSPRLAALRSFKYMDNIVDGMKELENSYTQGDKKGKKYSKMENLLLGNAKNYAVKNPIFSTMFPNFFSMYNRKADTITRIRILQLSCSIRSYFNENHHFPQNLEEIRGNDDIITDLNTGKLWNYTSYGDSAAIFSQGPSITDTSDDVSITLTTLGIKEYFSKMRKSK